MRLLIAGCFILLIVLSSLFLILEGCSGNAQARADAIISKIIDLYATVESTNGSVEPGDFKDELLRQSPKEVAGAILRVLKTGAPLQKRAALELLKTLCTLAYIYPWGDNPPLGPLPREIRYAKEVCDTIAPSLSREPELIKQLSQESNRDARLNLVKVIIALRLPGYWGVVERTTTQDSSEYVRNSCAEELGARAQAYVRYFSLLNRLLDDGSENVRISAAQNLILARVNSRKAVGILVAKLGERTSVERSMIMGNILGLIDSTSEKLAEETRTFLKSEGRSGFSLSPELRNRWQNWLETLTPGFREFGSKASPLDTKTKWKQSNSNRLKPKRRW